MITIDSEYRAERGAAGCPAAAVSFVQKGHKIR